MLAYTRIKLVFAWPLSGTHTLGAISKIVLGSGYNGILEDSAEGSDLYKVYSNNCMISRCRNSHRRYCQSIIVIPLTYASSAVMTYKVTNGPRVDPKEETLRGLCESPTTPINNPAGHHITIPEYHTYTLRLEILVHKIILTPS